MEQEKLLKYDSILPENWDGQFKFSNWTDEDFVGKWGGKEYHYPAGTMSVMVIADASPLEVQYIRKKMAYDLAVREYFKTKKYQNLLKQERTAEGMPIQNSIHQAGTYNDEDIKPLMLRCLEPLELVPVIVTQAPPDNTIDKLSRDGDGNLVSEAIDTKVSLKDRARKI